MIENVGILGLYSNYSFDNNEYPKFYVINKVIDVSLDEFDGIGDRVIKEACCDECDRNNLKMDIIKQIVEMLSVLSPEHVDVIADYVYNIVEMLTGDDTVTENGVSNINSMLSQLNAMVSDGKGMTKDDGKDIKESAINHLTPQERLKGKLKRRQPGVKRALKIRRMKNKKCPKGTSWSSKTRSCTKIDPKKSRTMKRVAKFRRYN